jgi:predicted transcriptional regulator
MNTFHFSITEVLGIVAIISFIINAVQSRRRCDVEHNKKVRDVLADRDKIIDKITTDIEELDNGRQQNRMDIGIIKQRLDSMSEDLHSIKAQLNDVIRLLNNRGTGRASNGG